MAAPRRSRAGANVHPERPAGGEKERAMPRSRRRRDRPVRLQAPPSRPAGPTLAGRPIASAREWRWRTFPVFFTFAATLFLTVAAAAILPGLLLLIAGGLLFALAL